MALIGMRKVSGAHRAGHTVKEIFRAADPDPVVPRPDAGDGGVAMGTVALVGEMIPQNDLA
jgi:hypothetical protein